MAESVVCSLISKLTTLLAQEYALLEGLGREVENIRDELGSMRAFLRIAEAKQDAGILNDEQKEWTKQVMEVAHDTEDAIDEFLLYFPHERGAGFFGHIVGMVPFVKKLPTSHQIATKISRIKVRLEQISARHQRYQSIEGIYGTSSWEASQHPIRAQALLLDEADLVGIESPKSEIISLILTNESHRKAIALVGMGGSGKTTLVKAVYDSPDVKRDFSIHAWLTISETFIIKDALKDLIAQLCKDVRQPIPGNVDSMHADELRAFVKDFLRGKRYFIVLDDLWKSIDWESIKLVFPDDRCASRILVTTRIKDLASTCCREFQGIVYMMKQLSTHDSWQLFCKKTFVQGSCPPHLEDISRRIITKCQGLPLGIIAIGGLLALRDTSKPREWEMVFRSLGGELEGNGKLDPIRKILLLSYNDLPYYLKPCLLYMSIFPEDEIVGANELAILWIAEGFVEVKPGVTTKEVAQSYLNELIGRSLIQVATTDFMSRPISCRVHDLMYEIILSKCREYYIVTKASTPNTTLQKNVRRLSAHDFSFVKEPVQLLRLRSLIRTGKFGSRLSDSSLPKLLKGKLLKVLDLQCYSLRIIPNAVLELRNLTYLNLSNSNVLYVTNSIRNLQNLEYLGLLNTKVYHLPADIIMLKKLWYLGVSMNGPNPFENETVIGFKAPQGLGDLFLLQELLSIVADSVEVIREIGKLTHLRTLCITKITRANGKELCSSLEKLPYLEELTIESITRNDILDLNYSFFSTHKSLHSVWLAGGLVKIPDWVIYCHGLSKLSLLSSRLEEDPLRCLDGLPNLVDLQLYETYVGDTLNFRAGGFQNLKALKLSNLNGLKSLRMEKGTLPNLLQLNISRCMLLEELPHGVQYLSKLGSIHVFDMPKRPDIYFQSLDKESDDIRRIAGITEFVYGRRGEEYFLRVSRYSVALYIQLWVTPLTSYNQGIS